MGAALPRAKRPLDPAVRCASASEPRYAAASGGARSLVTLSSDPLSHFPPPQATKSDAPQDASGASGRKARRLALESAASWRSAAVDLDHSWLSVRGESARRRQPGMAMLDYRGRRKGTQTHVPSLLCRRARTQSAYNGSAHWPPSALPHVTVFPTATLHYISPQTTTRQLQQTMKVLVLGASGEYSIVAPNATSQLFDLLHLASYRRCSELT